MVLYNMSKHCSMSHFLWLLVTNVTPDFASFLMELGHKPETEYARSPTTERSESLKSVSNHLTTVLKDTTSDHFPQLLLKDVTSHLWISILNSTEVQIHSLKTIINSIKTRRYLKGFNN